MKTKIAVLFFLMSVTRAVSELETTNDYQGGDLLFKQSRSMANAIAEIVALYHEESRLPAIMPDGTLHPNETGLRMHTDFWNHPFSMQISPSKTDILVTSYGSDGARGGEKKRADWVYELSLLTNAETVVRILDSPNAELSRFFLANTLNGMKNSSGFPSCFSIEMPNSNPERHLAKYPCHRQRERNRYMASIQHFGRENGLFLYLAAILLAIGWFWFRAVFREQTKYLFFVVVLCFPLLYFWWSFASDVFGFLGFATLILKATRSGSCSNQKSRAYLAFFIAMILLAILSGLII